METEVERLREEKNDLLFSLRSLLEVGKPLRERVEELYREGWSNRRISEALGITLQEARRLTFLKK